MTRTYRDTPTARRALHGVRRTLHSWGLTSKLRARNGTLVLTAADHYMTEALVLGAEQALQVEQA